MQSGHPFGKAPLPWGRKRNTMIVSQSLLERAVDAQIPRFIILTVNGQPLSCGILENSHQRFDLILFSFMNSTGRMSSVCILLKILSPFFGLLFKKILRYKIYPFCMRES